jgi:hypothetical protein
MLIDCNDGKIEVWIDINRSGLLEINFGAAQFVVPPVSAYILARLLGDRAGLAKKIRAREKEPLQLDWDVLRASYSNGDGVYWSELKNNSIPYSISDNLIDITTDAFCGSYSATVKWCPRSAGDVNDPFIEYDIHHRHDGYIAGEAGFPSIKAAQAVAEAKLCELQLYIQPSAVTSSDGGQVRLQQSQGGTDAV